MAKPAKKAKAPEEKKMYTLVRGTHDYRDEEGELMTAVIGDEVALTENQYNNFRDKFEDPDQPKMRVPPRGGPVADRSQTEPADAAQLRLHEEEMGNQVEDHNLSAEPTTPGLVAKEKQLQDKKGIEPEKDLAKNVQANAKVTKDPADKEIAESVKPGQATKTK